MKIVASMMIRNEQDIIKECLTEIVRWGVEIIAILDGGSDDGTIEKIGAWSREHPKIAVDLNVVPDPPGDWEHNMTRSLQLELTRQHKPDWILSLDADEIYHTDPVRAIVAAERAGANVVWQDIPEFWITLADVRNGLVLEDERLSVQLRRRWYSWGHTGCFIWKDHPEHHYPIGTCKRTPDYGEVSDYRLWQVAGPVRTVCKHYCFRSLAQAVKRQTERLAANRKRYFGKYALDWIIDERVTGLAKLRDGGEWSKVRTHEAVKAYMGRFQ